MSSRLKNLYKYLIENRKHEMEGWHDAYKEFHAQVKKVRERVKEREALSQQEDKDFLKQLLYDKNNGVASRGQSVLSNEDFESFIRNSDFLSSLQQFIQSPTKDQFNTFKTEWSDQGKGNNPVLVNRVAAACTLDVSTTVDEGKFKQVFNWLIHEKIISEYPANEEPGWYPENLFLLEKIKDEFKVELKEGLTDDYYLSQFVWVLYENMFKPFSLKKQIVKYGAPGTGKTYQARQQTSLLFDIWKEEYSPNSSFTHESQIKLVQFHSSYSYEDFMEGLRPVLDDNGAAQLTLQNGVFKQFCLNAGKWEIDVHALRVEKKWEKITIEDLVPYKGRLLDSGEHWRHIFELAASSKLVSDAVPPFFFIIDEINRAELSRVFGELMYCLEYRGAEGKMKTQYANLNSKETGMLLTGQGSEQEYWFFVPTNVYLIGTMNTIDRSVESFDFALRRRFRWEEVTPDTKLLKYHLRQLCKKWEPLADNLEKLNGKIAEEPLLGHDYQIGHAYLMDMKYATSLTATDVRKEVWDDYIRPLLQEYLRGTGKETELIKSFRKAFFGS